MAKRTSGGAKTSKAKLAAAPMEGGLYPEPKPSLHLRGKQAAPIHKMKPGSMVRMMVHARVGEIGLDQYGPKKGNKTARLEIHRITNIPGTKKGGK